MERKKIVGYLPRLLFKIYLSLKEKFDPRPPITQEEQYSIDICKQLIPRHTSKLNYAPKSTKRIIKNDEYDMFIVINNSTIHLINHVYSYSVYIENTDLYMELLDKFDLELEKRRQELEDEIVNNIQHSLKNILERIN